DRLRAPRLPRRGAARGAQRERRGTAAAERTLLSARRQLDRRSVARELLLRCLGRCRRARRRGRNRRGGGGPGPRRAAPCLQRRAARAQRSVLVWLGQEVQALPRGMTSASSSEPTPARLAAIRDQLQLLADYLLPGKARRGHHGARNA